MKTPKPRRPITILESTYLKRLNDCTFMPGSPVKRFVRTMQGVVELTDKQAEFLRATVYHYRRQLRLTDKEASSLVDEMATSAEALGAELQQSLIHSSNASPTPDQAGMDT